MRKGYSSFGPSLILSGIWLLKYAIVWRVRRESIQLVPFRFPCHDWLLGTFSREGVSRVFSLDCNPSGIGFLKFSILGGGGRVSLSSHGLQDV